ncbi:hypothetical protein ACFIJ5_10560 [Haloimpatiens sp. FM7330]|uniref:hypothetical protein n=1 Tax=Haloimpatiens sp. FM7330 TaxID=3298610 RepID=UPI0036367D03
METKIYDLLEKMYVDFDKRFTNIETQLTKLDNEVNNIETHVNKNSLMLEKIQTSFSEQLDRAKDKDGKTLGERLDVIELDVTNTSKSVSDAIEAIDVIKDATGSHEMDIKILKKLRSNHSF